MPLWPRLQSSLSVTREVWPDHATAEPGPQHLQTAALRGVLPTLVSARGSGGHGSPTVSVHLPAASWRRRCPRPPPWPSSPHPQPACLVFAALHEGQEGKASLCNSADTGTWRGGIFFLHRFSIDPLVSRMPVMRTNPEPFWGERCRLACSGASPCQWLRTQLLRGAS